MVAIRLIVKRANGALSSDLMESRFDRGGVDIQDVRATIHETFFSRLVVLLFLRNKLALLPGHMRGRS